MIQQILLQARLKNALVTGGSETFAVYNDGVEYIPFTNQKL